VTGKNTVSVNNTSDYATRTNRVSAQTFQEKKEKGVLSRQRRKTLEALHEFEEKYEFPPTCQELKRFINETKDWYDPMKTQMQPRLTSELPERGMVEIYEERMCGETGEEVDTWTITQKGRRQVQTE